MPAVRLAFEPLAEPTEDDQLLEHVDTIEETAHLMARALRDVRRRLRLRPDLAGQLDPVRLDVALADLHGIAGAGEEALVQRLRAALAGGR